jgi:hypothetical protein
LRPLRINERLLFDFCRIAEAPFFFGNSAARAAGIVHCRKFTFTDMVDRNVMLATI